MRIFIQLVVLIGIYKTSVAFPQHCNITLHKDGNIVENGAQAVSIGGELNQVYCKALCSGSGSPPALKWYKEPGRRPIRWFRGRVYQVRTTFERVSILTIRNMLYRDTAHYTCKGWLRDQGWIEKSFELVYGCRSSDHLCDTSRCLSEAKVCDGVTDCNDGTDEQQCVECKKNQFQCDDGQCLPDNVRCDGYYDCVGGSDEYECGCRPDFACEQGGCVSMDKVCDGVYDCNVGEDEVNCTYCNNNEFHCGNKVCIASELACNRIEDCEDGADEANCPVIVEIDEPRQEVAERETVRYTCSALQSSIDKPYELTWSRSDEELPYTANVNDGMLVITDVTVSDAGRYMCTGSDGFTSDQAEAELIVNERCAGSFECYNGKCIPADSVCNSVADCPDEEDELDCSKAFPQHCNITLHKDDNIVENGAQAVSIGGELNKVYCKALCSGSGSPPALKWYKEPGRRPIRWFRGRVYQVRTTFERVSILTIRNMLYRDTAHYTCKGWLRDQGWIEKSFELVYGCRSSDHLCDTSRCLSEAKVCDGVTDCNDGTDEQQCVECKKNQFQCDDGQCLPDNVRCDGYYDCVGGSDEYECGCQDGFECMDGTCLEASVVCDGFDNCQSGEDEANCTYCDIDEFHCGQGVCIPDTEICDRIKQCKDASDELNCGPKCEDYQIQCVDGGCVNSSYVCDRVADCPFSDDEVNCRCYTDSFKCDDGQCVDQSAVCNGTSECVNGKDEEGCPTTCNPGNEFTCESKDQCIPLPWRCDGSIDCTDGSDECGCAEIEFKCDSGMCINNQSRCDNIPDCANEEDEKNCPTDDSCPESKFLCKGKKPCISTCQVCDGKQDCEDNWDESEENCGIPDDAVSLQTDPEAAGKTIEKSWYDEYYDFL